PCPAGGAVCQHRGDASGPPASSSKSNTAPPTLGRRWTRIYASAAPYLLSVSPCRRACARALRERDALHRAGADAKLGGRLAYRQTAPTGLTDSFLEGFGNRRAAQRL